MPDNSKPASAKSVFGTRTFFQGRGVGHVVVGEDEEVSVQVIVEEHHGKR